MPFRCEHCNREVAPGRGCPTCWGDTDPSSRTVDDALLIVGGFALILAMAAVYLFWPTS